MSDVELRREVLRLIAERSARGTDLLPSDLLKEACESFHQSELAVREVLWRLITTDAVELTQSRRLRPTTQPAAISA